MKFLTCAADVLPCPLDQQQLVSLADLLAEAVSQLDAASIAQAYAFGAASVVTWWGLGYALAVAIKSVNKA
ncbi:hypothetical protein [Comamonas thiooxydans]|uniref:Uncharacterized protein n=1 Tax=Comamonas thiooxydans TaxID=363952 RepID=A0A0E3BNY8_9BURK|nr:hypothetical protein [Comamonas thiooxydans]KGH04701.1 hypothetical protein P608_24095 [Comamonas thiooxydans]KGH18743.1 hypothetical protein P607_13390 [Comamonas thiooxydans]KGH19704.1 hypothetical protein P606_22845 [Comamonas thiooxydans]